MLGAVRVPEHARGDLHGSTCVAVCPVQVEPVLLIVGDVEGGAVEMFSLFNSKTLGYFLIKSFKNCSLFFNELICSPAASE